MATDPGAWAFVIARSFPKLYTWERKTMRHQVVQRPPRNTGMVDRMSSAWDTGTKLFGIAQGVYSIGKVAAPYIVRAAATAAALV